jgi:hypothetical protein
MVVMDQAGGDGRLVIFQNRQWAGDPRLGAFIAKVDDRTVGKVAVQSQLSISLPAGTHTIYVRQAFSWLESSPIVVDIDSGSIVRFKVGIPVHVAFPVRFGRALLKPRSFILLERLD